MIAMDKKILIVLLLIGFTSTLASPWAMQNLRNQKEVKQLELNQELQNERQKEQLKKQQIQKKFRLEQEPHYKSSPVFKKSTQPK